ncbi:MAG: RNA polymerase sigma factor, partial [Deltaproteobacteria bacterium]|nr:RNA polymerase sigma factor [Deltaproteobacteria bacterium]
MADLELNDEIRDEARVTWYRYLDLLNPFRPDLYRYCLRLTGGDVWDAEDLVQETVVRGFATLGARYRPIDNPRGYLVRIASNLWMDAMRRRQL